jgi:hypothetical protein
VGALLNLRLLQIDGKELDLAEQETRRQRRAVLATPGRSLPIALNVKEPVGDGGWTTFSRSHRKSSPALIVWRPFSQVNESATSVTPVAKSEAVLGGEPSCW